MRGFHVFDDDEIRSGRVTDVYFERTLQVLRAEGISKSVVMEVTAGSLPDGYDWGILAGIEELAHLLDGVPVDALSMAEGSILYPGEPVMRLEGRYEDFGVLETALLGLLCQASGVATKAARCKRAADGRAVSSFGARRMHPALAPMIDRSAFIGGCDGVAVTASAELLGEQPVGTMPHSLILLVGDSAQAFRLFDRHVGPETPRICLIDTFNDEKFEALTAAQTLGDRLFGVRLDTPASRRGNMKAILSEVRWELDLRGFSHVKLLVSGGLDERDIPDLNEFADAYGVGTCISNAPTLDFAMDIVEIEGVPGTKRGKKSGRKQVLRCLECLKDKIVPDTGDVPPTECLCGATRQIALTPFMRQGRLVRELPTPQAIRASVLGQLGKLA
jgi:nicotinate phosphoribosyltransferase